MIHMIAAATTQSADAGTNIQISIPAVVTFAGICALSFTLIKIGDILWGRGKNDKNDRDDKDNKNDKIVESMGKLGDTCVQNREKLVDSTNALSNAMTKYIELQQASLKLAEYRHETITKQLEGILAQAANTQSGTKEDIRDIHSRLHKIALSIGKHD